MGEAPPGLDRPPEWLEEAAIVRPEQDRLRMKEAARDLASALREAHPTWSSGAPDRRKSFVVTIEAPWGSGKSSFANLVAGYLRETEESSEDLSWQSPVVVDFSAWQSVSMGGSPWEALAYRLGEGFYRRLHRLCLMIATSSRRNRKKLAPSLQIGNPRFYLGQPRDVATPLLPVEKNVLESARWFGEPRLHWREVAFRLAQSVPSENWDPCMKLFVDAPSKLAGREMGRDEAFDTFVGLMTSSLSVVKGEFGDAISGVGGATRTLLRRRLLEGPEWGIDTREFARALDRLIYVLHPRPRHWRAFVVLDDVARLPESEFPAILEALTHLREIHDIVVMVNLPPRALDTLRRLRAPGVPVSEDGADGESFLTRLVQVRFPLPRPDEPELSRMMADALGELRVPAHVADKLVRHYLDKEAATPRQLKQLLQWLWFRLRNSDGGSSIRLDAFAATPQQKLEWLLTLLIDLHLHAQGRNLEDRALDRICERREILLHAPVQPWDLRAWRDGMGVQSEWCDVPEGRELLATVRLQELLWECGERRIEAGLELGRRAWRAWQFRLGEDNELKLSPQLLRSEPDELMLHLSRQVFSEERVVRAQLAGVARYHHFAHDEPDLAEPEAFARLARFWYFDSDALWAVASRPGAEPKTAARAWILLSWVTPAVARRFDDWWKRSPGIRAHVPERSYEKLRQRLHRPYAVEPAEDLS